MTDFSSLSGLSGWNELQWKAFEAVDDVVDRPFGFTGDFDAVDALDKGCEHGLCFQPCETLACATVCAVTEAELAGCVPTDIEGVGVVPFQRVAVGRGVDHH